MSSFAPSLSGKNYVRRPSGILVPDDKIIYFDGIQPIWVLGGTNDTVNTIGLSADAGGSFSKGTALKLSGDEAAGNGSTAAYAPAVTLGGATRFEAYWRYMTLNPSSDINHILFRLDVWDGTNLHKFRIRLFSAYDVTQQIEAYNSSEVWVNINADIPWASALWSSYQNEFWFIVDLTNRAYEMVSLNGVSAADPQTVETYQGANTQVPSMYFWLEEQQAQTEVNLYLSHAYVKPLN